MPVDPQVEATRRGSVDYRCWVQILAQTTETNRHKLHDISIERRGNRGAA
jgi:hypothetical protein